MSSFPGIPVVVEMNDIEDCWPMAEFLDYSTGSPARLQARMGTQPEGIYEKAPSITTPCRRSVDHHLLQYHDSDKNFMH
jgi:hypothetical protein